MVLFAQSFGMPMVSMELLLSQLDVNPGDLSAVNKTYVSQLITAQHLRGVKAGHKFKALLLDDQIMKSETGVKKPGENMHLASIFTVLNIHVH